MTGKICDFDYVTSITGLEKIGETYQIHLNQQIDVENDQLLMTYRSNDEAVFAGMRVFVDLGGSYIVKDVFKMEGFPQRVSFLNLTPTPSEAKLKAFQFELLPLVFSFNVIFYVLS